MRRCLKSAAEEFGVDPKSGMWQLPPSYVGKYAEQDALITLKLWENFQVKLNKEECTSIFSIRN